MKRLSVLLLVLVLALSFAACSGGIASKGTTEKSGNSGNTEAAKDASNTDAANVTLNADGTNVVIQMGDPKYLEWPKDILHPDMPEYKKGKMNGWAPWDSGSKDNIFILVKDTSKEDMDAYIKELEAAGFAPDNNEGYHKDLYDVSLQMNSDSILQISSYKTGVTGWPDALSSIPPIKGGDLTVAEGANEEYPDSLNLYYINLPRENLEAWRQELGEKGFDVKENTIIANTVQFNGNTYPQAEMWYEENGTNEWNIYFEFKK